MQLKWFTVLYVKKKEASRKKTTGTGQATAKDSKQNENAGSVATQ